MGQKLAIVQTPVDESEHIALMQANAWSMKKHCIAIDLNQQGLRGGYGITNSNAKQLESTG